MVETGAIFSDDLKKRFKLWRIWSRDPLRPLINFIMLNPSSADATLDDPTIRRCVGFAERWGLGGIVVTNLYPHRSPYPDELFARVRAEVGMQRRDGPPDYGPPFSDENDRFILEAAKECDHVCLAWGAITKAQRRAMAVVNMLADRRIDLRCLGLTTGGSPRHPLYLEVSTELEPFELRTAAG